ncbi:MAG: A/G-specific adenine glycosylase [Pirellulales bacterium]
MDDELLLASTEKRRVFRRRLLAWYRRHARDLPWRRRRDAYRIWVSEVMLQQTQVATVVPYFQRFLATFPSLRQLAAADEQQVLRLWEGLGYYRRARQMHQAARLIVEHHGGRFPRDREAVLALPGIGRYTAGAILSIAFDLREPIVEANTIRLLARLIAYRDDPRRGPGERRLWEVGESLLPRTHVGQFNQALMELGSLVCTTRDPACSTCPVAGQCGARAEGLQESIPPPKRRPKIEHVREAAVVIFRQRRVLIVQCGEQTRWSGLWDFPRFPVPLDGSQRHLIDQVRRLTGVAVRPDRKMATLKHSVTRFRITLDCHLATYLSRDRRRKGGDEIRWVRPATLADYPLSTTGRKLGRMALRETLPSTIS